MQEEKPTIEHVTLPTGGSIPGIPGMHAPGRYIINWLERTLTPVVEVGESAIEHVEEAISPKPAHKTKTASTVAPMPTEPVDVPELGNTPAPDASEPTAPAIEERSAN